MKDQKQTDQDRTRTERSVVKCLGCHSPHPTMSTVLLHGRIPGWIAATCAAGLSNARCPTACLPWVGIQAVGPTVPPPGLARLYL